MILFAIRAWKSGRLRKQREISGLIVKQSKVKPTDSWISFDTRLRIALSDLENKMFMQDLYTDVSFRNIAFPRMQWGLQRIAS